MDNPRHEETQKSYDDFKAQHESDINRLHSFDFNEETIIREFIHWVIIKNRFPYDRMSKVNDMLVSRRAMTSHYNGTQEEQTEYHTILKLLADEGFYDALIENFPKVKSVKKFAHTHLVVWHTVQS